MNRTLTIDIPEPERKILCLPGGVEMAFRLTPAGSFRMGSQGMYPDEEPTHWVKIERDFWMAETPVTQAQFAVWTQAKTIQHENRFAGRPEHPAENVDWRQAVGFCAWMTQELTAQMPDTHRLACLPTEAEWEYACRAGTDTEYYTGDGEAALKKAGRFGVSSTRTVRQKKPNAFHLYDLHGNVWEWCHDVWDETAYRKSVDDDSDSGWRLRDQDYRKCETPETSDDQSRVLRGGSWKNTAWDCRSACRRGVGPGGRFRFIGFRVCLVRGPVAEITPPISNPKAPLKD